jgi:GTP-binding protein YchF
VHIVRAFESGDVIHVADRVDPKDDIEVINTELILADMQTIENRLPKLQKEAKAKPAARAGVEYLQQLLTHLQAGTPLSQLDKLDIEHIGDLHLLTAKPVIYAFNVDEDTLVDDAKKQELATLVSPARAIFVCAKLEDEIKGLTPEDAGELLESYGVKETGLQQMIHAAYDTLGLQSYLTAGPKEVRAWTIKQGSTAPQAAGVIHTDFERGFIAAQIVDFDDLIAAGSEVAAKQQGKMRTEGKEYVMQPGDIVEFRFNV